MSLLVVGFETKPGRTFRANGPSRFSCRAQRAFSLIEMALSLAVIVFALFSIIGLLGIGLQSNHISIAETKATDILTTLKADCLNSRSSNASNPVGLLNLPLPYSLSSSVYNSSPAAITQGSSSGLVTTISGYQIYGTSFNSILVTNMLYTTGMTETETPVAAAAGIPYQASIVYTFIPASNSRNPIQARLIVNWPCRSTTLVSDLTDLTKVNGYVETDIAFPSP